MLTTTQLTIGLIFITVVFGLLLGWVLAELYWLNQAKKQLAESILTLQRRCADIEQDRRRPTLEELHDLQALERNSVRTVRFNPEQ